MVWSNSISIIGVCEISSPLGLMVIAGGLQLVQKTEVAVFGV